MSELPTLLIFTAEWCAPSKRLAKVLEDEAGRLAERVVIRVIDIDDTPEAPAKYAVRGFPQWFC